MNEKYVVVDLEMCNVPKQVRKEFNISNETIQIGAVLVNDEYEIIDEFSTFVKPQFGKIDSFISDLTGITAEDVEDAPVFEDALKSFMAWVPNEGVKMVSWSDSDRSQITKELLNKGLVNEKYEEVMPEWIDCQQLFAEKKHNNRCYKLSEALITCDIDTVGREHDGLDDAYNTALLFKKIMNEPELKLSRYIIDEQDVKEERMTYCLGDVFAKLNLCLQ